MADNRLYIGNKNTLEYICISKAYSSWSNIDSRLIDDFLTTFHSYITSDDIVMFTEKDNNIYDLFIEKGKLFKIEHGKERA